MATDLNRNPIHLGLGAKASVEPPFDGMEWYAAYGERHAPDGAEGRLVMMHTFDAPWATWEVHPHGHEIVICTAGEITLIQEIEGKEVFVTLSPGQYAINDPGVWHTADVSRSATALFITAGLGTENRPR